MLPFLAILLSAILIFLSAIHVYWALGGKWGAVAAIPTTENGAPLFKPGIVATVFVAGGLAVMGLLPLVKVGLLRISCPDWATEYGLWVVAAIFLLRAVGEFRYVGFFKKVRDTQFGRMDMKFYSPLCLVIGCLAILLQYMA